MVEFLNVSKVYANGTEALHNINLKIEKGEFVFIVGSSGAGKSTFLKLIMCEERPNGGKIIIDDNDITSIRKRKIPFMRRKMGIVFQDFRLINHMTVYDNVAFAMRVIGASSKAIKKRIPYILSLVGLQHKAKHKPGELSGGERQRVGLARALVNNPTLIIADEPTGNIDPALSFEIVDLLNEINRCGTTILMVTHEHSLVKHFHKRIIQIHSGEIVADTAATVTEHISKDDAKAAYEKEKNEFDTKKPQRKIEHFADVDDLIPTQNIFEDELSEENVFDNDDNNIEDISQISVEEEVANYTESEIEEEVTNYTESEIEEVVTNYTESEIEEVDFDEISEDAQEINFDEIKDDNEEEDAK